MRKWQISPLRALWNGTGTMSETPINPPSPCIGICMLNSSGEYCIGCYRKLDEIADWTRYTAAQKQAILEQLPARHELIDEPDPAK